MNHRNILFFCILHFTFSISSKTFSQNQTFPDGLSIVCKYDRVDTLFSSPVKAEGYNRIIPYEGKHIGYVNYRCGVIDAAGNVIVPLGRQVITRNGDFFIVGKNRYMLIDTKGSIIGKYDFLAKMSDKSYRATKNGKYGVVDIHGKEIIPCKYVLIEEEIDSYRVLGKNRKWGVIDSVGKIIIPCEYDLVFYNSGLYMVHKEDKWGVFDSGGKMIIPLKYVYLSVFENGVAKACECDEFIRVNISNQIEVRDYEKKGYVLINNTMVMCKNPVYSELKIKNLTSK